MFPNLKAEMARIGVTSADISRVVRKTDRNIRDKISGKGDFTLSEITSIRDAFFPGMSLEYLFAISVGNPSA